MLKREFTKTEEILLLVMVAALLGLLYYQMFYKVQITAREQFDTATLEDAMITEQAKATKIRQMQEEIETNKEAETGVVKSYNNLTTEIDVLNDIFADAVDFQFLGFDQAYADGDAVRRNISATFTAVNYEDAKQRLTELHNCEDRCLIRNISIASTSLENYTNEDQNLNEGPVSVSFTVTFYETLYNATTLDGLAVTDSTLDTDAQTVLDQLADSKETVENMGY